MTTERKPTGLNKWLRSGTTGASAEAIVAHLADHGEQTGNYPLDASDFGRCERLLKMVPGLRSKLSDMAEVNVYWAALVQRWDEIRAASDSGRTTIIREIVTPIQSSDPGHIQISPIAHARIGHNSFKGAEGMKMKETDADRAVRDTAYRVTAEELRSFIERFERLDAEKKDIADQQKEVMAEAKARGYDTKCIRKIIAERKRDRDDVAEEQAVMDLYREALGM